MVRKQEKVKKQHARIFRPQYKYTAQQLRLKPVKQFSSAKTPQWKSHHWDASAEKHDGTAPNAHPID